MNHYWYMYLLDIWLTFWVGRRPEWHWPRCPRPGYRGHTPPPPPPTQTSSLLMPRRTMAAFFLAKSPTCIKQTKLYMMIHVSVVTGDNRLANFECQSIPHTAVNYLNYVKSILMFTIYTQIREKKAYSSFGCRGGRRKGSLNHSLGEGFLSLGEGFLGGPPSVRVGGDRETETRMYGGWFHGRLGFTRRATLTRLHLRWCNWNGHIWGFICTLILSKFLNKIKIFKFQQKSINLQN